MTAYYDTLPAAWEAAQGQTATIEILKNVDLGSTQLKISDANTDITLEMADDVTLSGEGAYIEKIGTYSFIDVKAGHLTLKSGIIKNTYSDGFGVSISGGSFTMVGGKIDGETGTWGRGVCVNTGSFTMNGGEISAHQYGVFTYGETVTINAGKISVSYAENTPVSSIIYGYNSNVYIGKGANLLAYGEARGIRLEKKSSIEIAGGTITSNANYAVFINNDCGGDVVLEGSVTGGTITGGENSYGICASGKIDMKVSGGTFYGGYGSLTATDLERRVFDWLEPGYAYYDEENKLIVPDDSSENFIRGKVTVGKCTHAYGEWSSAGNGTHTRTCSICGEKETVDCSYECKDLSPDQHIGSGGTHSSTCSVCGYRAAAEPHTFGSWAYEAGTGQCTRSCKACQHKQIAGLTQGAKEVTTVYRSTEEVTLSVQATDAEASYAWKRQGEEAVIEGAAANSYQLPADLAAGDYKYECAVTMEEDSEPVTAFMFSVSVKPASIVGAAVTVNGGDTVYYDGTAKTPDLTVVSNGEPLKKDKDYTVAFTYNVKEGTAGYTLTGIGNYTGTLSGDFTIQRYTTDVAATAPEGWANSAAITAPSGYTISFSEVGDFSSSIIYDTQTEAEGTEVSYYLKQDGTGYITDAKTLRVKVDITAPSMSGSGEGIKITNRDAWWQKLLTAISFHYYKPQQATVKASDALSGIAEICYYIDTNPGKTALTAEDLNKLDAANWKKAEVREAGGQPTPSASVSFPIDSDGSYVIYAYAADQAGNRSAYVCSDGIVLDSAVPTLTLTPPDEEGKHDTSAIIKMQMNEAGTVCYIVSDTEISDVKADTIQNNPNKKERSVTPEQAGSDQELQLTGLKPNTMYYVYAVGTDAAGNTGTVAGTTFTTLKTAIAGTLSVTGKAVYGETLRAAAQVSAADAGAVSYQWYRVDDNGTKTLIAGETSAEHKVVKEDIGCCILVEVTAENCSGKLEEASGRVEKADAPTENMPENGQVNDEKGTDTFTFTGKDGVTYEYSTDGGNNWKDMEPGDFAADPQDSGKVTGTIRIGNYACAAGSVQVRAKETDVYKAGAVLKSASAFTAILEGSVTLTGAAKYGEKLSAEASGTQAGAVLSYSFYRSGQAAPIQSGFSNVYTLTAGDIGKTISVKVTAAGYEGALTAELAQTVEKADGKAISVSVAGTAENDGKVYTYTMPAIGGAEYKMDSGDWQKSNVFTEILPGSSHAFSARMAETDCYKAGTAKDTGSISFPKLTPAAPMLKYQIKEEEDGTKTVIIEAADGAEYSFDGGKTYLSGEGANRKAGCSADEQITLAIRLKETETHNASSAASVTVDLKKKQRGAPEKFELSYTANGETDYTVSIPETAGCEYSFDGANWSDQNTKEGAKPGDIVTGYKRYKETAEYNAGGAESAFVRLPKFTVKTPIISPVSGSFTGSVSVSISCGSQGAEIYYTTDGSIPTRSSARYTGAFTVSVPTTVKAIAVKDGFTDSAVAEVSYTKQDGGSASGGGGSHSGGGSGHSGSSSEGGSGSAFGGGQNAGGNGGASGYAGNRAAGNKTAKNGASAADEGGHGERKPFIKGKNGKEGWNVIHDEEEKAEEGSTINVDMNGASVVPGDIFNSMKGRNITVTFDMDDGIIWSVDGRSVTTDKAGDIDFSVETGTGAIPIDMINQVAGENYHIQISLSHEGEFGFTAVLSINLGRVNAGHTANLYYYDEKARKLKFICADEIAEDGTAELTFTHASDYLIAIDTEPADEKEETDAVSETAEDDDNNTMTDTKEDAWSCEPLLIVAAIAVAAGIFIVLFRKREKEEE